MKITGREGSHYTEQEINDAAQNHANTYSQDPHYLKSIIFGKKYLNSIEQVEGCKGIIFIMGLTVNQATGEIQEEPIPVPVDAHGNRLPLPWLDDISSIESTEAVRRDDDDPPPVKCPIYCS